MVYPLPPGQGDSLGDLRRDANTRLDEVASQLDNVRMRLSLAEPGSPEALRLKREERELIDEASGLLIEIDNLEEPEEGLDEDGEPEDFDQPDAFDLDPPEDEPQGPTPF